MVYGCALPVLDSFDHGLLNWCVSAGARVAPPTTHPSGDWVSAEHPNETWAPEHAEITRLTLVGRGRLVLAVCFETGGGESKISKKGSLARKENIWTTFMEFFLGPTPLLYARTWYAMAPAYNHSIPEYRKWISYSGVEIPVGVFQSLCSESRFPYSGFRFPYSEFCRGTSVCGMLRAIAATWILLGLYPPPWVQSKQDLHGGVEVIDARTSSSHRKRSRCCVSSKGLQGDPSLC
jgi:hypothetical protein